MSNQASPAESRATTSNRGQPASAGGEQAPHSRRAAHGRFAPGVSGNPSGRLPGTRNRATALAAQLLEDEAPRLIRKCIALALGGDTTALRLCLDRILPPVRDRPVQLAIPSPASPAGALHAVLAAVASGELTPDQGRAVAATVADWSAARHLETVLISADEVAALAAGIADVLRRHVSGPTLDAVVQEIAQRAKDVIGHMDGAQSR
ncbi:MAG TPA: DUF5681 domain-containing protein [Thermoanaerobaculia bacterium]